MLTNIDRIKTLVSEATTTLQYIEDNCFLKTIATGSALPEISWDDYLKYCEKISQLDAEISKFFNTNTECILYEDTLQLTCAILPANNMGLTTILMLYIMNNIMNNIMHDDKLLRFIPAIHAYLQKKSGNMLQVASWSPAARARFPEYSTLIEKFLTAPTSTTLFKSQSHPPQNAMTPTPPAPR